MRTFVISLKRRHDRKILFSRQNNIQYEVFDAIDGLEIDHAKLLSFGFDTDKDWIDPINETHISYGEIGCYLSHYQLWIKCIEINEPIIILEDDAIVTERFSVDQVKSIFERGYNFVYLGYNEMRSSSVIDDDDFVIPDYPYWTVGYALTPEAAQLLIENRKNIIPVDEYLSLKMKDLNPIAYRENVVNPIDRSITGTDVDPMDRYQYFLDFQTHTVTVGSDNSKCQRLYQSSEKHGFRFKNIGQGIEWNGTDMSGPGGGQKINLLKNFIKTIPDHDVVLFADGYDTFTMYQIEEIERRYLEFKCRVLFAAEEWCWPDEELSNQFPHSDTPYRYLNSGLFIGRVSELRKILAEPIKDNEDDQLYYQKRFLSGKFDIKLDYEAYIFQCHDPIVCNDNAGSISSSHIDHMYNPITKCFGCMYHGNGGDEAKQHFQSLYDSFYGSLIVYIPTHNYEVLDKDMLLVDFLSPAMCDRLIEISDRHGGWNSLSYDKFPGQEIRLKELKLWEDMENHWQKYLYPIIEEYWKPMEMYGMRDAFVMRYSMDTQRKLNLHTDASLVTGSVKLNDDYEGAELIFPRQGVSNKNIDIGKCILFPGAVTHGHECTELKSGVKYSFTMWSSRYHGDVL